MNWFGRSGLYRHARALCAALIITGLFAAIRMGDAASVKAPADVTSRFKFARTALPEVPGPEVHLSRTYLHPSLKRIPAFMSTIGASAAMNDLDRDGLPNDVVFTETRTDQVIVAPVPGTGDRYAPFALDQGTLFDRGRMAPLGVLPGDFNEDGATDILVLYAGRSPLFFLRRASAPIGPGAYRPQPLVEPDRVWVSICVALADFDGDGHADLMLGNYFKDGSDIMNPQGKGVVELPYSQSRAYNGGGERVFRWVSAQGGEAPAVKFEEVSDALPASLARGWPLAMSAYDLDGDVLPEVYVAHDFGPDLLLRNLSEPGHIRFELVKGRKDFFIPANKVLGYDSFKSMGVDFGDINGDGLPDIYVSNMTTKFGGYESQEAFLNTGDRDALARGLAPFLDSSEALGISRTGWAWEARLADFNNDGTPEALQAVGFIKGRTNRWPELQELAMANDVVSHIADWSWPNLVPGDDVSGGDQNPFFVRAGERYVNIAAQIGFKEDTVSRGIATGDVDGDGRLDMVVSNMWGPSTYYHNECTKCAAYLGLHVVYPAGGGVAQDVATRQGHPTFRERPAVGAAVEVLRQDGRVLIGQVDGGSGHTGKRSSDLLFGLGDDGGASVVTIRWRACGTVRTTTLKLPPGWHTILLPPGAGGCS